MTLSDGILDTLKDDGESIIEILKYLNSLEINNNREMVKEDSLSF